MTDAPETPPAPAAEFAATSVHAEESLRDVAGRLAGCVTGVLTSLMCLHGHKLGLYNALARLGPSTSDELAKETQLHERWVREWLYQQAAARLVACDAAGERFWLTEAQADALASDRDSPAYMGGMVDIVSSLTPHADAVANCFRTGLGHRYDALGCCGAASVHSSSRPWIRHQLLPCLATLPGLLERLEAGVQAADVGCGAGEALMLLAARFSKSTFTGYDTSDCALELARTKCADLGLTNLQFCNPAKGADEQLPSEPRLAFVLVHDAFHDMTRPDLVMSAIRAAMLPDGMLVIGDITSAGSPASNIASNPAAALAWGFSVSVCMSSALSEPGGLGLGTLGFDEETAQRMCSEAGFNRFQRLEWQSDINTYFLVQP